MLMTMEMWWLGFYMDRLRLTLFILLNIPMLIGLSHYSGFEQTVSWKDDVIDAFVAYAVGFTASAIVLVLFGVLKPDMSLDTILGKIALQAIPASIGALLAQSQLGGVHGEEKKKRARQGYAGELFTMAVGAIFLAFNLSPTEEMVLIAHKASYWHLFGLALLSILVMHAFVYTLSFHGQPQVNRSTSFMSTFARFTLVGYALVLLVSAYVLWTFGRMQGLDPEAIVKAVVVLAFPGAIGAAAARLIL